MSWIPRCGLFHSVGHDVLSSQLTPLGVSLDSRLQKGSISSNHGHNRSAGAVDSLGPQGCLPDPAMNPKTVNPRQAGAVATMIATSGTIERRSRSCRWLAIVILGFLLHLRRALLDWLGRCLCLVQGTRHGRIVGLLAPRTVRAVAALHDMVVPVIPLPWLRTPWHRPRSPAPADVNACGPSCSMPFTACWYRHCRNAVDRRATAPPSTSSMPQASADPPRRRPSAHAPAGKLHRFLCDRRTRHPTQRRPSLSR